MFYRRSFIVLLLLLSFSIVISGCKIRKKEEDKPLEKGLPELEMEDSESQDEGASEEDTRETILFYQDDFGYLVPIMRKLKWEEGIAKAALMKLMDAPEQQQEFLEMGLNPLFPANTEIMGISIDEGTARLDLNEAAMEYPDAVAENNMVQGVVMTLTEFPAIEKVQFLFDNKIIDTLSHGTKVGGPIEPEDINLEVSSDSLGIGGEVTVFFHNTSHSRYEYFVPVTRITSSPSVNLETALEELLKGPKEDGNLRLDIPDNTKLLDVEMDDGITYVNFSKEFNSLRDTESEGAVLKTIALTAGGFPGISNIKIMVEGEEYKGDSTGVMPVFANEY